MSEPRAAAARRFADRHGWAGADMRLIAGDASMRKYYRLARSGETALVMDAPPEKGEDTRPFARIAAWLCGAGFSAPRIHARDTDAGFLLLEDFGDGVFARLIEAGADETLLYGAATDLLAALHRIAPPDLPRYDAAAMAPLAGLAVTWYRSGNCGQDDAALAQELSARMHGMLVPLDSDLTCLAQRDYHAENLIWLPERSGVARVGLLDFQDAMIGHPAYDLVSILQDARRDVPPALAEAMIARYLAQSAADPVRFRAAFHLLGLQRNLRILGVFARLCLRDGKPGYLPLIPRVWGHIAANLAALGQPEFSAWIAEVLPAPTEQHLARIAARCP